MGKTENPENAIPEDEGKNEAETPDVNAAPEELAGAALAEQGNPAVDNAAGAREAADATADNAAADVAAVKTGEQPDQPAVEGVDPTATYTVLHAMLRNDEPLHPGDTVSFDAGESEHVAELLSAGVIVEGTGDEAAKALGRADLARGSAASRLP